MAEIENIHCPICTQPIPSSWQNGLPPALATDERRGVHTQLRLSRSQLNDHLFSIRLSPSSKCLCGAVENTSHFLLDCFLYNEERLCLFNDLRGVLEKRIDRYSRNELVQILLNGEYPSDPGKYAHNKQLFSYVQKFLVSTKRLVYKSKLQYNPL